MNAADWQKAKEFIAEALLLPSGERSRFLDESCIDPILRAEIAALLQHESEVETESAEWDPGEAKRIFCKAIELPSEQRAVFLQSVCKDRVGLHRRVRTMIKECGGASLTDAPAPVEPFPFLTSQGQRDFVGNARFAVQRQLGAGAFGTVYQAWDREQQTWVALKVLHSRKPDLLFRFKREFRALVDVRHPNLVRLYELFADADQWFFSMELIEGDDFLTYVRPLGICRFDRLRPALAQLAHAIHALHQAKRLHRDLKPANALVTGSGRVVVLDFGLVRELDGQHPHMSRTQIAGTPAYMAPEQLQDGHVSEASDWFAAGVMLFEALTGSLPYDGWASTALSHKSQLFQEPRTLDLSVPIDLNDLCRNLLSTRPQDRPHEDSILSAVAVPTTMQKSATGETESVIDIDHFVGRAEQLGQLATAFKDSQEGRLSVVLMHGPSGIGKTALAKRFLAVLSHDQPRLIILKGRCYEFESVPYKGVDALVDELSRYLDHLPDSNVERLLPRDAFLLPKLFPVLGRIRAIAAAPILTGFVPDAQELRQRSFAALRELLARLSDRQPLVIWIDDLQWGDRDSTTFLADLCTAPQPTLLVLLAYRSEDETSNPTLTHLHDLLERQDRFGSYHDMPLGELSNEESRRLLGSLLPNRRDVSPSTQQKIAAEACGHPLFLQQLAHFAASGIEGSQSAEFGPEDVELKTLLRQRITGLPAFAREVLEFACIAAQPLSASILFEAAESRQTDERAETLALLVRESLARLSGVNETRKVEAYHDQIRSVVVSTLDAETRRARHKRLAEVLLKRPNSDPEAIGFHLKAASDVERARRYLEQAAKHSARRRACWERTNPPPRLQLSRFWREFAS